MTDVTGRMRHFREKLDAKKMDEVKAGTADCVLNQDWNVQN